MKTTSVGVLQLSTAPKVRISDGSSIVPSDRPQFDKFPRRILRDMWISRGHGHTSAASYYSPRPTTSSNLETLSVLAPGCDDIYVTYAACSPVVLLPRKLHSALANLAAYLLKISYAGPNSGLRVQPPGGDLSRMCSAASKHCVLGW